MKIERANGQEMSILFLMVLLYFPIKKVFRKTIFLTNFIISELIMSEVTKYLRNIFGEVGKRVAIITLQSLRYTNYDD